MISFPLGRSFLRGESAKEWEEKLIMPKFYKIAILSGILHFFSLGKHRVRARTLHRIFTLKIHAIAGKLRC